MPVKLQPTSVIKARLGIDPNGRVQKFFTHTCRVHNDKYVPFRTGALAGTVTETNNTYTYEQEYARYMYNGISKSGKPFNYNKDKHPLAGQHWDKRMVTAEMRDIEKEVQEFVKRGA